MSQQEMRVFEFKKGVRLVQRIECDWVEVRRSGNELADELGPVDLYCYIDPMRRWERMGTFYGKMQYINLWGEKCQIRSDFMGLDSINKKECKK